MDFFEGLERGLGLEGFGWFRKRLSHHLGFYYELMLRETCKKFYFKRPRNDKRIIIGQNFVLLDACCRNGNINILNYMLEHNWSVVGSHTLTHVETTHLSIVKWAEQHPYVIDTQTLVLNACKKGYKNIVVYGLERRICNIRMCFEHTEDIEMLDFIMTKVSDFGIFGQYAEMRFSCVKTEAKLCWIMSHHHIPYFNVAFTGLVANNIVFFVEHANQQNWTNTRLIEYVIGKRRETRIDLDWKYPRDKCNALTDAVARAFSSSFCECDDPANHERRKRIKS